MWTIVCYMEYCEILWDIMKYCALDYCVPMSGNVNQALSKVYPGFTMYCEYYTVKIGVEMIFAACDLLGFIQTCCVMSS